MSDSINQIRFVLRSLLSEEIQEQAIIAFEALPGGEGEKAEWQSFIRITGFERSVSRGTSGFGGGGTEGHETEEDVGAWKVLGLPDRTATGMNAPSPWIVFMDWMWGFLKSSNLNPNPAMGFGEVTKAYSQLTPAQKRQRKYGTQFKSSQDPDFADAPARQDLMRTRPLRGGEHLWPAGFHIKREVSVVISPLGMDRDTVSEKFREIMSKAKAEPWFRVAWNGEWDTFFVYVNIDAEMPEGWRDRLAAMQIYHSKRKAEWADLMREFSQRKANVAQLRPILSRYMVDKEKFERPFNIDVLSDEEYERAKKVLQSLKLEDLVAYAKSIGVVPPVVGQIARGSGKNLQYDKMWDNIIERLANQGIVDILVADVALSNWMAANGFQDPFEFESLPPDKKLRAIHLASRLKFEDIRGMVESVRTQINSLLG
jgi:hypothetical protein